MFHEYTNSLAPLVQSLLVETMRQFQSLNMFEHHPDVVDDGCQHPHPEAHVLMFNGRLSDLRRRRFVGIAHQIFLFCFYGTYSWILHQQRLIYGKTAPDARSRRLNNPGL